MASQFKIRRQRPIRGGRLPLPSTVLKDIDHAVEKEANRHRVSKSWVIATILAYHFGIDEQISYLPQPKAQHMKVVK
jgi:hypothetical protein